MGRAGRDSPVPTEERSSNSSPSSGIASNEGPTPSDENKIVVELCEEVNRKDGEKSKDLKKELKKDLKRK